MSRSNLFFKVEVEHDSRRAAASESESEICRQLMKLYGVREAEVSSFATMEE